MYGDHSGWALADGALADVGSNLSTLHRHHGYGSSGGEPEGLVISARVVTDLHKVAEEERHRRERWQTRSSRSCNQEQIYCYLLFANEILATGIC